MITLIVPTRNRAHTLRLVAPSYFAQDCVDELIFVVRGNLPRYEKPKPTTAEEVVERAVQSGV